MQVGRDSRIRGAIFGCAVGDALGFPVEFQNIAGGARVVEDFTRIVRYKGADVALFSDDTQMFTAALGGLLDAGTWDDVNAAGDAVAGRFVEWATGPENTRAPGGACMEGCRNLANGSPWPVAGRLGASAGGCGGAMRSGAYGLWFPHDARRAALWAAQHCQMTHRWRMAQASSAAIASGVSTCMGGGASWEHVAGVMVSEASVYDVETAAMINLARRYAAERRSPQEVLDRWRGWAGHEAVAASLYCALMAPYDPREAILLAVNSPGDSDSLGAITGTLVGAYHGWEHIPEFWCQRVEKADQLAALADEVVRALGVASSPDVAVGCRP